MIKPKYRDTRFHHWTTINVRFRDLDPLKHVNNAVFNTYFEEARIDFIETIPAFKNSVQNGFSFVLVHISIDYINPVFMGDTLLAGTSVEEFGNSSIKGIQAMYDSDKHELKAVAKTTGVWLDLSTHRPARLPDIENRTQYLFNSHN